MTDVSYGGVYRAVCLEVLVDRVRAQVPQLFSTETVTIFECAGPRPAAGDQGWVSFEGERSELPIWMGSESKGSSFSGGNGSLAVWPPYYVVTQPVQVDNAGGGSTDITLLDGSYAVAFDGWAEVLVGGGYGGFSSTNVNVRQGVYSPTYLDPTGQPWLAFGFMASPGPSTWETIGDSMLSIPLSQGDAPVVHWRGNWSPSNVPCSFRGNATIKFYAAAGQADILAMVGPAGPVGPPGPPGGTYEFLLAPTPPSLLGAVARGPAVAPAPGEVVMNSTNQLAVTALYVSTQTVHGVDITNVLASHNVGFHWYLYDKANPSRRMEFEVTSTPINQGSYFEFDVSLVQALGPIPMGPIYGAGVVDPTGGGGGGGSSYRYVQGVAAAVWNVTHGLGYFPNVTVVDSSGREVVGEVTYVDVNTVTLTFSAAFGGEAYFS